MFGKWYFLLCVFRFSWRVHHRLVWSYLILSMCIHCYLVGRELLMALLWRTSDTLHHNTQQKSRNLRIDRLCPHMLRKNRDLKHPIPIYIYIYIYVTRNCEKKETTSIPFKAWRECYRRFLNQCLFQNSNVWFAPAEAHIGPYGPGTGCDGGPRAGANNFAEKVNFKCTWGTETVILLFRFYMIDMGWFTLRSTKVDTLKEDLAQSICRCISPNPSLNNRSRSK